MSKNENYGDSQLPQEGPIAEPPFSQHQIYQPQFQPVSNMSTAQQQQQYPLNIYPQYTQQQQPQQILQPQLQLQLQAQQLQMQQRYTPVLQHPHSPIMPHLQLTSYQVLLQSQAPFSTMEQQQQQQQQRQQQQQSVVPNASSQEAIAASANASASSVNTNVDPMSQQLQPTFNSNMHSNETLNQIDQTGAGSLPIQQQYLLGSSQEVSSSSIPASIAHTERAKLTANYVTTTTGPNASNQSLASTNGFNRPPIQESSVYPHSQSSASTSYDENQQLLQSLSHAIPMQPPTQFQVLHLQLLPLLTLYQQQQTQPLYTRPPLPYQPASLPFAPTNLPTLPPHHHMDVAEYPDMTTFVNSNINSIPIPLVEARFVDHRICEICGKRITRDMSRHMRTHQSEARFTCEFPKQQCRHKLGKFNRPYDYKKHLLNRHYNFDDPEVKKLHNLSDKLPHWGTCPCGLRFTGEAWLDEHILTSDLSKRCPMLDPK